jgi:transposase
MTCQDVADHLGVSWDLIRDIEKTMLKRQYARPPLKDVTHIAIDEIAIKKGHTYLTVVMDLDTRRIIFVGDGKGGDALKPFWRRLKRNRVKITAVCSDMSPAYISAIQKHLPDAIHIFDRFHIMKLFNAKLTALRRRLYSITTDKDAKDALKGIRFSLLKREVKGEESDRLEQALKINSDLSVAYILKEELYEIWEQDDEESGLQALAEWIGSAEWSEIPEMVDFAKTLRKYNEQILGYYYCELTSGPLEGMNNKIKVLKRQSYGFRDSEYFKLKILAIHKSVYKLAG